MTKKICVTSVQSVGCTFVDWSIHFLSGQSEYYSDSAQWVKLSHNPITSTNAHGHKKNHPSGAESTKMRLINADLQLDNNQIYSVYPFPMHLDVAAKRLGIKVEQLCNSHQAGKVQKYIVDDYNKIFDFCQEFQTKVIFVESDPRTVLYHLTGRVMERFATKPERPKSMKDLHEEHQNIFFKDALDTWNNLNLTNIWDVRERLALNIRPFNSFLNYKFVSQHPHLWINSIDLWTRPLDVIKKIMSYVELEIVQDRLDQWLPIQQQWQKIQLNNLTFCYNQPHIVDAIVNNLYYEIDLTFEQETVIQHCLLYQHGLNLKTWQLEKFPNNTQDLHKLLEPNIHPVPKIYQDVLSHIY